MDNVVRGPFRRAMKWTLLGLHLAAFIGVCLYPPWRVSWAVLGAAFGYWCVRGLVITVGYHRYFTHGDFACSRSVKYALAFFGCLPLQGSLDDWCPDHRQHHAFTDKDWDPHSPWTYITHHPPTSGEIWRGFWWAQIGWLFWTTLRPAGYNPSNRAEDRAVIAWQKKIYWPVSVGLGFILPLVLWGMPGLVWCGFIGVIFFLHCTWFVNSVTHLWGDRPLDLEGNVYTKDQSRNNLFIALLTFGEGWHGNHHVQQRAADLGRGHWWDPGYWLIVTLERCGLVWDVHRFPRSRGAS